MVEEARHRSPALTRFRFLTVAAVATVAVTTLAACSSSSSSGASSTSSSSSVAGSPSGSSSGATSGGAGTGGDIAVSSLPASVQSQYQGYQTFAKLQANPYANWTPPKAPYKFCLNDSYTGNAFRQTNLAEYQNVVKQYQANGVASGPLVVTDSNNDQSTQISQFNTLVNGGCNVIFSLPGSPTAMCSAFTRAKEKGILVVTDESPVDCADSINVTWNGYVAELTGARAVMKAMGGKGNLVAVTGIAGVPAALAEVEAVKKALSEYPDVKLLGSVAGMWTPSVTSTAMAQFLATHPQQVDGVIDAGAEDVAAEQALQKAGRPLAKINSITGECSFLAFWHDHPEIGTVATNQSGGASAYETFLVAMRMLNGQKPMVNTIFYPVPSTTPDTLAAVYKPSMTVQSTCIPLPPGGKAAPDTYFDAFLSGGTPLAASPATPID